MRQARQAPQMTQEQWMQQQQMMQAQQQQQQFQPQPMAQQQPSLTQAQWAQQQQLQQVQQQQQGGRPNLPMIADPKAMTNEEARWILAQPGIWDAAPTPAPLPPPTQMQPPGQLGQQPGSGGGLAGMGGGGSNGHFLSDDQLNNIGQRIAFSKGVDVPPGISIRRNVFDVSPFGQNQLPIWAAMRGTNMRGDPLPSGTFKGFPGR